MSMDSKRTEANRSNGKRRHAPSSRLPRAKFIRKDERDSIDLVCTLLLVSLCFSLLRLSTLHLPPASFPHRQRIRPLHPAPPKTRERRTSLRPAEP